MFDNPYIFYGSITLASLFGLFMLIMVVMHIFLHKVSYLKWWFISAGIEAALGRDIPKFINWFFNVYYGIRRFVAKFARSKS